MAEEIHVVGIGAVTPAGVGVEAFWNALLKGESVLGPVDIFPGVPMAATHGGRIDASVFAGDSLPRAVKFAAAAAREALSPLSPDDAADCALIAATNFGADCPGPQDTARRMLAEILGTKGRGATISLSCASGASAIAYAADIVSTGIAKRALVVGFDELSPFAWSGLCALRTMTRESVVRPFDAHRSGTLFSEGAAAVLVEGASACTARGGAPLAVLAGWATGSNGFHLTAPSPRGAGSLSVMRRALERAGATPAGLDYFNAHGTGTKHNDLTETQAFQDLCGDRAALIPVSSVKGTVGHLLGAAGTAEVIATVMSIREGVIPPTANLAERDAECPLDIVCGAPRKCAIRLALSNSAGIGGCNAAIALRAVDAAAGAAPTAAPDATRANRPGNAQCRCVITGAGILSPLGIGAEENILALGEGEPALEEGDGGALVGRVPPFDLAEFVPSPKNYLDRQSELLLAACGMAIAQAGGIEGVPPERRAVCAATAHGGSDTVALFTADLEAKGPRLVKPMLFQHAYANTAAALAAMEWGMRGPHLNFTTGRLASAQALSAAIDAIQSGEADIAVACAAESLRKSAGAGRPQGEAGVALVIESERHAASRGAKPIAAICRDGQCGPSVGDDACGDPAARADELCGDTEGAAILLRVALDAVSRDFAEDAATGGGQGVPSRRMAVAASAGNAGDSFALEAV